MLTFYFTKMTMDTDELIQCPYNKSHSILKSKMQFHLMKCRVQYPGLEKATCLFNSTHIVNKIELQCHCDSCPDRIVVDGYLYVIGPDPKLAKPSVSKIELLAITGKELWDDATPRNVLETVQESCKTRLALQTVVGVSKSERKAFRHQQRLKAAYLTNTPGSTTNGSQRTTGNASGAQQTPRRTLNNPWGTSNPTAMNNENRAQRNEDVSESVGSQRTTGNASGAQQTPRRTLNNPWGTSNPTAMNNENRAQRNEDVSESVGSQRTTGNASGAQQTPRRTLNNPWGTSNPTAMNNENRAQRNEDVSESVGSQRTTGNASGAQQTPRRTLNNPWGTSNPTAMNNENRAQRNEDVSESVVSISSQQEAGAVRKMVRDPSNPWSSSFITSTSSVLGDNSGFPGLPVTARRQNGRGPNNRN